MTKVENFNFIEANNIKRVKFFIKNSAIIDAKDNIVAWFKMLKTILEKI